MSNRKFSYTILLSLFVLMTILFFVIENSKKSKLEIVFMNVGQGDSFLISRGSYQILVDGGKDEKILLEKLGRHIPFWDRTIEMVIATHPDQDHIGGLIDAAKKYKIKYFVKTNSKSDSQTYKKLAEIIEEKKIEKIEAIKGLKVSINKEVSLDFVYPFLSLPNDISRNSNDESIVFRLSFGENSFLFTGDLPSEKEMEILKIEENIKSDVLKVAHHGSKYSTSEDFLAKVKPSQAIISVGKNNSYGHPNQQTMERLIKGGVEILRTDEIGDVIYLCKDLHSKCEITSSL